jgi:hypothetical protein
MQTEPEIDESVMDEVESCPEGDETNQETDPAPQPPHRRVCTRFATAVAHANSGDESEPISPRVSNRAARKASVQPTPPTEGYKVQAPPHDNRLSEALGEALRRNKLKLTESQLNQFKNLLKALQSNPQDSPEWSDARLALLEKHWYLQLAGSQAEFEDIINKRFATGDPEISQSTSDECEKPSAVQAIDSSATVCKAPTQVSNTDVSVGKDHDAQVKAKQPRKARNQTGQCNFAFAARSHAGLTVTARITVENAEPVAEDESVQPASAQSRMWHWIKVINEQTGRSAESLIQLGQRFLEAKSELKHGEWEQMFASNEVRFTAIP